MKCRYCRKSCIKKGIRNKIQRYQCKNCKKLQQENYTKKPIPKKKYQQVRNLNNEGCSMSSIGRLLYISVSSVQRVIIRLAAVLTSSIVNEEGQSYEMDELRTYCGNKQNESWVIYAINRGNLPCVTCFVKMLVFSCKFFENDVNWVKSKQVLE